MAVNSREPAPDHATLRHRTDEAFAVSAPAQNPRIAPRLIPVVVTILIGVVILALLYFFPR
jgi:hypothetical protein